MTVYDTSPCGAGEQLRQNLTAVEIDSYCALAIARAAIRSLASASDEQRNRAATELESEIAGARLEQAPDAVVSLLEEMRTLLGHTPRSAMRGVRD